MSLAQRGWQRFAHDPQIATWAAAARPIAARLAADPAHHGAWLRHQGTWFVGVNLLPNDKDGTLPCGTPLGGQALHRARALWSDAPLDAAQVSILYPGYPKQDPEESDANHRFRKHRFAAHVDGLLPVGPNRRRMMKEPHAYVLGVPLTRTSAGAAPMVIWEGSHKIMQAAFRRAFAGIAPQDWQDHDITEVYQAARREIVDSCQLCEVHAQPGETYLIHRLALHGVAPWKEGAIAPPEGRMIAYFRPHLKRVADWLELD